MGLIDDAIAAREAHMSYGQYKAQAPYSSGARRFTGTLKKKPVQKFCEVCGKPTKKQRRFCCRECYLKAQRGESNVPV